jgi:hypothetical protein
MSLHTIQCNTITEADQMCHDLWELDEENYVRWLQDDGTYRYPQLEYDGITWSNTDTLM